MDLEGMAASASIQADFEGVIAFLVAVVADLVGFEMADFAGEPLSCMIRMRKSRNAVTMA